MKLKILFLITCSCLSLGVFAQFKSPVTWSYLSKRINQEAIIYLKADIEPGWHIYAISGTEGMRTKFNFRTSKGYILNGALTQPKPIRKYVKVLASELNYLEGSPVFIQRIKLRSNHVVVKGQLEYTVCNEKECRPAEQLDFSIPVV